MAAATGVGDNVVAVRESQQKLVGVDVTSGAVRWSVNGAAGDADGAPVVIDTPGLVLVRTGGRLTALDRVTVVGFGAASRWPPARSSGSQPTTQLQW